MHPISDATSSVPAFLGKLWKLVEDPSTNHLISWNPNGLSFTIRDQARFARELLPLYYKHNNMASFVRQLNMYGFHKVVSVDSGGLKQDKDEMEFAHMYFLQGQEFLLEHIKRKIPIKQEDVKQNKPEVMSRLLSEVRTMKGKQENVDSRLNTMKRENEALWREVATLRQKHMKQQQIVNKLIQFLISIVQPNGRSGLGLKRRFPLMLGEASRSGGKNQDGPESEPRLKDLDDVGIPTVSVFSTSGPIIHDVTDELDDEINEDLIERSDDQGPETELADDTAKDSPFISEILPADLADNDPAALAEGLNTEQPDFDTMVQLETGASPSGPNVLEKAIAGIASPMSPELLVTVDPREVNGGALLSFEESRNKGKESRGKSVAKKDLSFMIGEAPKLEKEELDNHLDNMQVDLDQLREVLSMQGNPLDPTTLLGLFSTDDTLAGNSYLSLDLDLLRSPVGGAITGSEMVAYGNSDQPAVDDALATPEIQTEVESTDDLFDLLNQPTLSTVVASPTKKRKKN